MRLFCLDICQLMLTRCLSMSITARLYTWKSYPLILKFHYQACDCKLPLTDCFWDRVTDRLAALWPTLPSVCVRARLSTTGPGNSDLGVRFPVSSASVLFLRKCNCRRWGECGLALPNARPKMGPIKPLFMERHPSRPLHLSIGGDSTTFISYVCLCRHSGW